MNPDVCVYCDAPGCLAGEVTHGVECPFITNLWPIDKESMRFHPAVCAACDEPFSVGDLSTQVTYADHPAIDQALRMGVPVTGVTFTVCLPCSAMGRVALS